MTFFPALVSAFRLSLAWYLHQAELRALMHVDPEHWANDAVPRSAGR